jgi:serpin B
MNRLFMIFGIVLLGVNACSPLADLTQPGKDDQILQSDVTRLAAQPLGEARVSELVSGGNAFAFELYRAITAEQTGNLIYSPYSISMAFAMVYAGARGQTEAQMTEVLQALPQGSHHPAYNALDQYLSSLSVAGGNDGEPFQLNIANAIWGQQDYVFKEDYLTTLAQYYGAGMRLVDFMREAEAARQAINTWVAEQTEGRIEEALAPGVIDALTRLVLVNAIYFKATWQFPFNERATQDGPFTLLDGSQIPVPLMHQDTARIPYFVGDGFQAALLPYDRSPIDMLVILPDFGNFEAVDAALSAELLAEIRRGAVRRDVSLVMPTLDFESELDLKQLLMGMGMTDAFGDADFSGITEGGGLFISDAIHKANITVDEKGTEAAAVTAVVMAESALETAELELTHPFIFAIQERETGAILFLGRVMNPLE